MPLCVGVTLQPAERRHEIDVSLQVVRIETDGSLVSCNRGFVPAFSVQVKSLLQVPALILPQTVNSIQKRVAKARQVVASALRQRQVSLGVHDPIHLAVRHGEGVPYRAGVRR